MQYLVSRIIVPILCLFNFDNPTAFILKLASSFAEEIKRGVSTKLIGKKIEYAKEIGPTTSERAGEKYEKARTLYTVSNFKSAQLYTLLLTLGLGMIAAYITALIRSEKHPS